MGTHKRRVAVEVPPTAADAQFDGMDQVEEKDLLLSGSATGAPRALEDAVALTRARKAAKVKNTKPPSSKKPASGDSKSSDKTGMVFIALDPNTMTPEEMAKAVNLIREAERKKRGLPV